MSVGPLFPKKGIASLQKLGYVSSAVAVSRVPSVRHRRVHDPLKRLYFLQLLQLQFEVYTQFVKCNFLFEISFSEFHIECLPLCERMSVNLSICIPYLSVFRKRNSMVFNVHVGTRLLCVGIFKERLFCKEGDGQYNG